MWNDKKVDDIAITIMSRRFDVYCILGDGVTRRGKKARNSTRASARLSHEGEMSEHGWDLGWRWASPTTWEIGC
jgi:hypothetical protein